MSKDHSTGPVRNVDCASWAQGVPPFRGRPAFRCVITYRNWESGSTVACFALVDHALYQVGGCFDPKRDLGVGKGRLLGRK
jgi:hypothetical protein